MSEYVYMRESEKWVSGEGGEWMAKSEKIPHSRYILKNHQCPGDILMLSACIRDIKRWNPHFEIDVRTSCDCIFDHNPYIVKLEEDDRSVRIVDAHYEIIHESNQNMHQHFIHGFIKDFNEQAGCSIKLTEFKPDVHLTDDEKKTLVFKDQPEKFVLLNSGGKTDYKTKWWWKSGWQEVIQNCPDIQFLQIGKPDSKDTGAGQSIHEEIEEPNVLAKINQTSFRELIRLVYQSVGTFSVVTSIMHLAAAFDRHACVIAGGHEPWWWEKYPGHDYFHTIGALKCCDLGGCWKKECENKNEKGRQKCMEMIDPKKVAMAIKAWFD
ncbi:MAG: glycosyltransferase family 9 protein [Promethearchaeota archaeon]|jgi:ADP-heptose:LPS heptosyltransferase